MLRHVGELEAGIVEAAVFEVDEANLRALPEIVDDVGVASAEGGLLWLAQQRSVLPVFTHSVASDQASSSPSVSGVRPAAASE